MSVNLCKGSRIDLSNDYPDLSFVNVGLGWDAADKSAGMNDRKGILGSVRQCMDRVSRPSIDIDASCILLDENNKVVSLVFFGNKTDSTNGVKLSGDDLTGNSSAGGDDEVIYIDLKQVGQRIVKLDIWANIYDCVTRSQTFGGIKNAFIRLVNKQTGVELCKYNLSGEEYSQYTAIRLGSMYRHNGSWKFNAVGEGTFDTGLREIKSRY